MAERDLIQQLEDVLRDMPDEQFRIRLRADLMAAAAQESNEGKTEMTTVETNYIREGLHSLNSYLVVRGADRLVEFLKATFNAEQKFRVDNPDGTLMHGEILIGDTVVEMGEGNVRHASKPVALHAYVADADDVYQRALAAGAESVHAPVDQEYGDREASIKDPSGNYWYIATHKGATHRPEGLRTVTPYLHPKNTGGLIDFLKHAFGAVEDAVYRGPDGTVVHAKIRIGDSILEMGEAHGQWQPMPANLHLYVPDTDATYRQALAAGAKSEGEPANTPYGDRAAGVIDPWGNTWWLATYLGA